MDLRMNPTSARACLHSLLDQGLQHHPETPEGLTSHVPMALQALQAMGADERRLRAFHAAHAPRFARPIGACAPAVQPDWRVLRAQADTYAALRGHFQARLALRSSAEVLREALPDLFSGAAAAAFHGPIRTAHALQAGHNGELACALAYWAWRWQPVAAPERAEMAATALDFEAWAARLEAAALLWAPQAPLISARIRLAEQAPAFQALAGALQLDTHTLPRVSAWAAARYAATRSFTVLHIVTGLHAIELLLAQGGEATVVLHALAPALTAAYLAARMSAPGRPKSEYRSAEREGASVSQWPELPAPRQREWPDIVAAAITSDDEHVIKLVHVAWQRFAQTQDVIYHQAALRAVS